MSHQFTGLSTADIYQGIIDAVCREMKDPFTRECETGLATLTELKMRWETAVENAVLFDRKPQKPTKFTVAPPDQRDATSSSALLTVPELPPRSNAPFPTVTPHTDERQEQMTPQYQEFQPMQSETAQQQNMSQLSEQVQYVADDERVFQHFGGGPMQNPYPPQMEEDLFDEDENMQQQYYYYQIPKDVPQALPMGSPQAGEQQQQFNQGMQYGYVGQFASPTQQPPSADVDDDAFLQLDGNGRREHFKQVADKKAKKKKVQSDERSAKQTDAERVLHQLLHLQLDGGGIGTASSDEEEYVEEEEEDPMEVVLQNVGGRRAQDAEENVEDEQMLEDDASLNSADDDDDGDLETLFDAEDTIICQYEKVHRARTKWKLNLKDGIMHIDRHDHCFYKAVGEAEF